MSENKKTFDVDVQQTAFIKYKVDEFFIAALIAEKLKLPYPLDDRKITISAKGDGVNIEYQAVDRKDSAQMVLTFSPAEQPAA